MANLTSNNIKKGLLQGTNVSDNITIDNKFPSKKVTVKANNGNDIISANDFAGDLYAYAGVGSDVLYANKNKNYLYGESGTNTFVINSDSASTTISAGKGKAIIDFSSIQGLDENFFMTQNHFSKVKNDLKITLTNNNDIIIKDFYKQRGEFIAKHKNGDFDLRELKQTTYLSEQKSANYTGTRLTDIIHGDIRKNTIKGGDGDDLIIGGDGNDKIYGENGYNNLNGGNGNDTIYGGNSSDTLDGGTGNNKLYGKSGFDTYIHSGGNDEIYIEDFAVSNIWLDGFKIKERIKVGNDLKLTTNKNNVNGSIVLKNFFKKESISNLTTLYAQNDESETVDLLPDDFYFNISGKGTIKGTIYNDIIKGSTSADKIYATGGIDEIYANKGNDKIYSNGANVTANFNIGDGKDTLYGDNFESINLGNINLNDVQYNKIKNDLIIKYSDYDSVTLSGYFNGDISVAHIETEDSSGLLDNILANYTNEMTYQFGDGTVKFYSLPNTGEMNNKIKFNGYLDLENTLAQQKGNDLIITDFGAKKDKLIIVDYFKDGYDIEIEDKSGSKGTLNEILDYYFKQGMKEQGIPNGDFSALGSYSWKYVGTFANDNITFGSGDDSIKTGAGHDEINAGGGNDTIYGGNGNDRINGESGYNKIYGDAGNDTITGGEHNDTIYGGDGYDEIVSNGGNDTIYGGNSSDIINAGNGSDSVDGGAGDDFIEGCRGNDIIKGGNGNDLLYGDEGDNNIYGGNGNDRIFINSSTDKTYGDVVHGDNGNDTITAETGLFNKVYGDSGNDVIIIKAEAQNNEIYGGSGNDYIETNGIQSKIFAGNGQDSIDINNDANGSRVDAGSGNDMINIIALNCNIEGGAGNDVYFLSNNVNPNIEDSSGNDNYIIGEINIDDKIRIDDEKGKDTLKFMSANKDAINFNFNISVNENGKIRDLDDVDVKISITEESGIIDIGEYFDDNCIERIEDINGYYITKTQMQNVAQEVAAWLVENNFYSVDQCLNGSNKGTSEQIAELTAIYENINWQM